MAKKQLMLIAAGIFLASQISFASVVAVGHCKSSIVNFSSIQAAVNAVPSGSTIYICPGTYQEQVEIAGKKLTLTGVQAGTQDAAVIASPAAGLAPNAPNQRSGGSPLAAQIWVHDLSNVTGVVNINNLTVDAANSLLNCAPSPIGILYQNASGTIAHVTTRNQETPPSTGCQSGMGILVQSGNATGGAGPYTSTVTVTGSTVHDFQKNGIAGQFSGTTLTTTGNTVLGQGPTTGAAENGIEIAFGATGKITGNSVSDFIWSPDTFSDPGDAAAGILIYDSGNVTISGNTVSNAQYGIGLVEDAVGLANSNTVTSNKVYGTHIFDGIDVCSDSNTVKSNTVNSSDEAGIHLDSSCTGGNTGNAITYNIINEACAGLLEGATPSSNTLSPNTYFNDVNTIASGDTCSGPVLGGSSGAASMAVTLKTHPKVVP